MPVAADFIPQHHRDTLALVSNGYTDEEIARMLTSPKSRSRIVKPSDVAGVVQAAMVRWNCRNRVEVAVYWVRQIEMEELRLSAERLLDQLEKFHFVCDGDGDCLVCDAKREAIAVISR